MKFETFLILITKIAEIKYPETSSQGNSLQLLLKNHLIPLYENIIKETDMGED